MSNQREDSSVQGRDVVFAAHRRYLVGIAYRMLGSLSEAEDVVQDAFLRWQLAEDVEVTAPRSYLSQVVVRLCIDRRRFAQARREQYVGTWLPEPVIEDITAEQKADLSFALLMTLERLNPLERAAFLLHDVFDVDYREIATVLKRTEAAVRQLVSRGRAHVQKVEPRYSVSREAELRLAGAFTLAAATGDAQTLAALLAEDAVMYVDGGGKVKVATHPIEGAGRIVRFITGVRDKRLPPTSVRPARVNGLPGLVIHTAEGAETLAVQCDGEKISAIYSVRNPDKLRHVLAGSARPGVDQLE